MMNKPLVLILVLMMYKPLVLTLILVYKPLVLTLILVYKPLLLLTPFCPATLSTFSGFTTA